MVDVVAEVVAAVAVVVVAEEGEEPTRAEED